MRERAVCSRKVMAIKDIALPSQERRDVLAEALEQSNVFIRRWDGVVEHWTQGCERLYGWTAEEAVGQVARDLLKTEFPKPYVEIQRQLLEAQTWQGELRQTRKDGRAVFVAAQWVLVNAKSGNPLVIATHTDITSRLEMQQELERANQRLKSLTHELERSNEELAEFARIASHDLSAPITTTRWLTDLLSSRHGNDLSEEGRKCVQQISNSLARMAELVDAILTHAQVGKSAIGSFEETDAEGALAAALENLRLDIATSNATIRHARLPCVSIQHQALTQLFQNLLANAIKYRKPGTPPQIQVMVRYEGGMAVMGVADDGIGVEAEWKERIFLPLQRRAGAEAEGSGIGLATCKKIVTRAGGRIWVESQPGQGATFYFTLPARGRSWAAS